MLQTTELKLGGVQFAKGAFIKPKHDAQYWAKVTKGLDFSHADRVPPALYNKVLWQGLMEGKPYPTIHNGSDSAALDSEDDAS